MDKMHSVLYNVYSVYSLRFNTTAWRIWFMASFVPHSSVTFFSKQLLCSVPGEHLMLFSKVFQY